MFSTLSHRLQTLQSYHRDEPVIWDIGCDHGLLGLSFVGKESVEEIHLVDPSADVMKKLKNKLLASHIPREPLIWTHETKGQKIILGPKTNMAFIAGMGGKEIQDILTGLMSGIKESDRFVISPHRKIHQLREWLSKTSLGLEAETVVFDNAQFYEILVLSKKAPTKVHPFGVDIWKGEVGAKYLSHVKLAFTQHKDPLGREFIAYLEGLTNGT